MLTGPNIWVPDRRIVVPPPLHRVAPFWRRPRLVRRPRPAHRPWCPLHTMADGDQACKANGDAIANAAGDEYGKCCCNPQQYIQARLCSDGSDANAWFAYKVVAGTKYVTVNGVDYALPAYLTKALVKYYVADGNNLSPPNTVGTLGAGFATTTSCSTCSRCVASNSSFYLVTIAGTVPVGCASPTGVANSQLVGSVDGTYGVSVPTCSGATSISTSRAYEQTYTVGANCASGKEQGKIQFAVTLSFDTFASPFGKIRVEASGVALSATIPAGSDCRRPITLPNALSPGLDGGQIVLATGGTVTIS